MSDPKESQQRTFPEELGGLSLSMTDALGKDLGVYPRGVSRVEKKLVNKLSRKKPWHRKKITKGELQTLALAAVKNNPDNSAAGTKTSTGEQSEEEKK